MSKIASDFVQECRITANGLETYPSRREEVDASRVHFVLDVLRMVKKCGRGSTDDTRTETNRERSHRSQ